MASTAWPKDVKRYVTGRMWSICSQAQSEKDQPGFDLKGGDFDDVSTP